MSLSTVPNMPVLDEIMGGRPTPGSFLGNGHLLPRWLLLNREVDRITSTTSHAMTSQAPVQSVEGVEHDEEKHVESPPMHGRDDAASDQSSETSIYARMRAAASRVELPWSSPTTTTREMTNMHIQASDIYDARVSAADLSALPRAEHVPGLPARGTVYGV